MIIEHALLQVKPDQAEAFAVSMRKAKPLVSCQPGFQSIEVRPSHETENQFLLLISWDKIESHRDGFRQSPEYQKWRALLHHFYDPMPMVSYFGASLFDD
ncbi:MAG: antibiotic biosynthesis monooxygenase [Parasphingorhabdus sp.]